MNLDSARNRIKIIEGLAARILRQCGSLEPNFNALIRDADTIQKQCSFLALDLQDAPDRTGTLNAHKVE